MNIIICPTLLFTNDETWKNEETRELFMDTLEKTLEYIFQNSINIFWNDILEELLWNSPNLLPWYDNESYRLIEYLHKCVVLINESCNYDACNIKPELVNRVNRKDIISPTLSLFHYIIANNLETSFVVDDENNKTFLFSCECHDKKYYPNIIYIKELNSDNVFEQIQIKWTNFKNNEDTLKELISLFIEEYFCDRKILYDLEFSNSFLSDVSSDYKNRNNIITSIANRIIRNQKDACNFASLDDEPIKGTNGKERSFRVNDECRIHYIYPDKGKIKLTEYSGLGEHNKKLSHTRR